MRTTVWGLFRRYFTREAPTAEVLALEEVINLTLDRIIEATIPAYLEDQSRATA